MLRLAIICSLLVSIYAQSSPDINPAGCGRRPFASSNDKIVGGQMADPKDWGWQVSVRTSSGSHFCGGSLINREWVVTAAHCISSNSPSYYSLKLSAYYRLDSVGDSSDPNRVFAKVSKVIKHKSYNSRTFENDIALLKLDAPLSNDFATDQYLIPVCLSEDAANDDKEGNKAYTTGWGTLREGGSLPNELYEVDVELTESRCDDGYGKEYIKSSMICADDPVLAKDACQGDSGGPLVVKDKNGRWTLVGITSWGYGCARPQYPGVYARASAYTQWVKDQIGSN